MKKAFTIVELLVVIAVIGVLLGIVTVAASDSVKASRANQASALCSIVQTALGGHQSVKSYLVPGGRVYDQRELVYETLNQIPGISAVKPKAAFYIFPKIDVKKFNITDDEQFALDLLHDKHVLLVPGKGFNWHKPDHFRVVYLPRRRVLTECMEDIADFMSTYRQA